MTHHWRYHTAVNRMSGLLALSLADASILQYDLEAMATNLEGKVGSWLENNKYVHNDTRGKALTGQRWLDRYSLKVAAFLLLFLFL